MKIKVTGGGSQSLHFTYWTGFGLGYERTLGIYFPLTNTLEVHREHAKHLSSLLKALGKYRAAAYNSSVKGSERKPVNVVYWY